MRPFLAMCGIMLLAPPAFAQDTKETKPLSELQALRIKVLVLERQVVEAQSARLYQEKALALNAAVEAAAKESEVDLKEGWQPDVDARVWRKGK